jgi:hypothetical protein
MHGSDESSNTAEFGPVPIEHMAAYLEALETIKVIRRR